MSHRPSASLRTAVERLDRRDAPATVTAQVDYRPFDFQLAGTVKAADVYPVSEGVGSTQDTFTGNFTATGRITYDAFGGQSGTVTYAAAGTGKSLALAGGEDGVRVAFQANETGTFSLADTNGTWSTTSPLVRTSVRSFGTANEAITLTPADLHLTFDPDAMTATGGWANTVGANTTSGTVTATVTQPGAAATDLSVGTADLFHDGSKYELKLTANVTGALMTAADEASPAARVSLTWTDDSGNRTQDAGVSVDVPWNAGTVTADVKGLAPPSWATGVKVAVAAVGWTETADATNNVATTALGDATDPPDPGTAGPGTVTPVGVLSGTGGPGVLDVYAADGQFKFRLTPFGPDWKGGLSYATGDVTGDGTADVVVGAGAGGGPHVKVFDGKSGAEVASFFAYDPSFTGGVNVAAGDADGNGFAEVVTGAGAGGGPHVKLFDGRTGVEKRSFFAFDPASAGGVSVAAADFDHDGKAEIVAGAGLGSSPEVKVFRASDLAEQSHFLAYDSFFRTGARVGTRTLADGRTVIVTGADPTYQLPEGQFDWTGKAV